MLAKELYKRSQDSLPVQRSKHLSEDIGVLLCEIGAESDSCLRPGDLGSER